MLEVVSGALGAAPPPLLLLLVERLQLQPRPPVPHEPCAARELVAP